MDYKPSVFWLLAEKLLIYPKTIMGIVYVIALFCLYAIPENYEALFLINEKLPMPNKNKWIADANIIYTIILIGIMAFRILFLAISKGVDEFNDVAYADDEKISLKDVLVESIIIFCMCCFYFDTVFFGYEPSPSSLSIYQSWHASLYFYCFVSFGLSFFFAILFFYGLLKIFCVLRRNDF